MFRILLGVIIGLLVAPATGKDTRQKVQNWLNDLQGKTPEQITRSLSESVQQGASVASDMLHERADQLDRAGQHAARGVASMGREIDKNVSAATETFTERARQVGGSDRVSTSGQPGNSWSGSGNSGSHFSPGSSPSGAAMSGSSFGSGASMGGHNAASTGTGHDTSLSSESHRTGSSAGLGGADAASRGMPTPPPGAGTSGNRPSNPTSGNNASPSTTTGSTTPAERPSGTASMGLSGEQNRRMAETTPAHNGKDSTSADKDKDKSKR